MSTPAAAAILVATWAGALLGARWPVPEAAGGAALVAAGGLVLARRRPRVALASACALVALVGALGAAVRTAAIDRGPLAGQVGEGRRAITADLVVVGDVRRPEVGAPWAPARLSRVTVPGEAPTGTRERVVLTLSGQASWPPVGAVAAVRGIAARIEGPSAAHHRGLGAVVRLTALEVRVRDGPPPWHSATTWLRGRTVAATRRHLPVAPASLLAGLVIGDTSDQPGAVEDAVRDAGLSHLVAVSGSNVAVVVAGVVALALVVRAGRRAGWWAAVVAVWWFALLVRTEPSVVRAAAMATLVLSALLIGRVRSTPHLLCTAGAVVLQADPLLAGRLGFVLSMAATAGVVLVTPAVRTWLGHRTSLPGPLRTALAATVGAQLAVAPILLAVGGVVHPASVPANLLAVPAAGVASLIGGVAAVVAVADVGVAGVVAAVARPALEVVLASARWFASPAGQRAVEVAVAVLAVVVAWLVGRRLPRPARPALPVVALVIAVAGAGLPVLPDGTGPAAPPAAVLEVLDVGQGDAVLLGDPTAGWVLVDGGPDPVAVAGALEGRGIGRLAAVVVSHPHADHTTGLAAVLGDVEVDVLVVGPTGRAAADVLAAARARDVPVVAVAAGDGWRHGAMGVSVLSPPAVGLGEQPNDNSLVLHVAVDGGRTALLTGDAEVVPQLLLADDPRIDVDVLKVPHHGGDTNADGFLAATTPDIAVISAGRGNDFGHPHPDVLADLTGVEVRRTDLHGDVVVPLDRP